MEITDLNALRDATEVRAFEERLGVSRRDFLKLCAALAATMVTTGDFTTSCVALAAGADLSSSAISVGGAIACNASGPRTLRYGPTRAHVRSLSIARADGRIEQFRRAEVEKNTVGLFPAQDPVDWFIGSEGILGVIVEAELALLPRPR